MRANEIADLAESLIPAEAVARSGDEYNKSAQTSALELDPEGIYRSWRVGRTLLLVTGSPNVEFFNTAVDELATQGWQPVADPIQDEFAALLRNDAEPGFSLSIVTGAEDSSKPGQIFIDVTGPIVETDGRPL